jgi:hypothetical protein
MPPVHAELYVPAVAVMRIPSMPAPGAGVVVHDVHRLGD